jgi:hypothetical protein
MRADSRLLVSLRILGVLFPVVGFCLAYFTGPDRPNSLSVQGILFLLTTILMGVYPNGVMAEAAQDAEVSGKRWLTFRHGANIMAFSGIVASLLWLFLLVAPAASGFSGSPMQIAYLATFPSYILGMLISFRCFPKGEPRRRLIENIAVYAERERTGFYEGINRIMSYRINSRDAHLYIGLSAFTVSLALVALPSLILEQLDPLWRLFVFSIVVSLLLLSGTAIAIYAIFRRGTQHGHRISLSLRFWVAYLGSFLGSIMVMFVFWGYATPLSLLQANPVSALGTALAAASIFVQMVCLVFLVLNVVVTPILSAVLTHALRLSLVSWNWAQLESTDSKIVKGREFVAGFLRTFIHVFVEITFSVLWVLVALTPTPMAIQFPWFWLLYGGTALLVYALLVCEYKGVQLDGLEVRPKLLRKLWSVLLAISVLRQVFNPEIIQKLGSAIPASIEIMLGMSLGFVATYQVAAQRAPLGGEFRREA